MPNTNKFISDTYGNLQLRKGILTTIDELFTKDNVKVLQFGFEPHEYQSEMTLWYYWWDMVDSKMELAEFEIELKKYFELKYLKEVKKVKALYVGWDRKEKGTY